MAEPARLESRAVSVLWALHEAGQDSILSRYFKPALATYESVGPAAREAAEVLFGSAARACANSYEGDAVRLLKGGIFQEGALL